ncbi:two-component regulator propeller domain-containing protein [Aliikangiella maris]|uniref:Two-component regulator propeller domain-containing protein n=2 Tax=Aliikangiella maris TaxID=3162458 RepID=A0ABV3MLX2_9GAMM
MSDTFTHQPDNPHSLSHNWIFTLHRDKQNQLWVGTYGQGISRYDANTDEFFHIQHHKAQPDSLASNYILTLYADRQGSLWFGTDGSGINRYVPARQKFHHVNKQESSTTATSVTIMFSQFTNKINTHFDWRLMVADSTSSISLQVNLLIFNISQETLPAWRQTIYTWLNLQPIINSGLAAIKASIYLIHKIIQSNIMLMIVKIQTA